jgi:hypothetical protein
MGEVGARLTRLRKGTRSVSAVKSEFSRVGGYLSVHNFSIDEQHKAQDQKHLLCKVAGLKKRDRFFGYP